MLMTGDNSPKSYPGRRLRSLSLNFRDYVTAILRRHRETASPRGTRFEIGHPNKQKKMDSENLGGTFFSPCRAYLARCVTLRQTSVNKIMRQTLGNTRLFLNAHKNITNTNFYKKIPLVYQKIIHNDVSLPECIAPRLKLGRFRILRKLSTDRPWSVAYETYVKMFV